MTELPFYIGLEEAQRTLAGIGVDLSLRQIKRAADPDGHGKRKLPFFVDPIDKRLKIDKGTLLAIYAGCQVSAEHNARISPASLQKSLDRRP